MKHVGARSWENSNMTLSVIYMCNSKYFGKKCSDVNALHSI